MSSLSQPPLSPSLLDCLQTHLRYIDHPNEAVCLRIEKHPQLTSVAKIVKSETIVHCFNRFSEPIAYPQLPKHQYLIACLIEERREEMVAVYSLDHMKLMYARFLASPYLDRIDWCVLELSEELESALLKK